MLKELGFTKKAKKKATTPPPPPAPAPAAAVTVPVPKANKSSKGQTSTSSASHDDGDGLGGGASTGSYVSNSDSQQSGQKRGIRRHYFAGGFSKGRRWANTPEGARADEIYASKKEMTQSEYDRYNRQSGGEQIAHTYDSPMDQAKYEAVVNELRARAKRLGATAGYVTAQT